MSDTSGTGAGAGTSEGQGPGAGSGAGDGGAGAADAGQGQGSGQQDSGQLTAEQIAELQRKAANSDKAVADAAKYRQRLREVEQEREAAARGNEDDQQRAERERKERESKDARLRELAQANAILRIGPKFNLVDADDAMAVLLRQPNIELDDDGVPVDLETRMRELVTAKPWLVKQAAGDGGQGQQGGGQGAGAAGRVTGGAAAAPARSTQTGDGDDKIDPLARLRRAFSG